MTDVKKIMEKYSAFREGQDWPNGIEEVGTLIAHIEKLDGENAALKAKLAGEIEYANNKDAMLDSVRKSSALKIDVLRAIVEDLKAQNTKLDEEWHHATLKIMEERDGLQATVELFTRNHIGQSIEAAVDRLRAEAAQEGV